MRAARALVPAALLALITACESQDPLVGDRCTYEINTLLDESETPWGETAGEAARAIEGPYEATISWQPTGMYAEVMPEGDEEVSVEVFSDPFTLTRRRLITRADGVACVPSQFEIRTTVQISSEDVVIARLPVIFTRTWDDTDEGYFGAGELAPIDALGPGFVMPSHSFPFETLRVDILLSPDGELNGQVVLRAWSPEDNTGIVVPIAGITGAR